MNHKTQHIGVVGAGAMGQGIAQVATQAQAQVLVFDVVAGAADKACAAVRGQWQKLQEKVLGMFWVFNYYPLIKFLQESTPLLR